MLHIILQFVHFMTAFPRVVLIARHSIFHPVQFGHPSASTSVFSDFDLRCYVPLNTKHVISETFFPANLLA